MISSNPFSQVSSSTNVFSPPISVFDYEKEDVHFNYHQLPIDNPFYISTDFVCPVSPPPVTNDVTTLKQDFILQQQYFEDHNDLLDSVISSYKKKTVNSKTDGRSKIYTAGGHRDRRVRLSIDIARKLFCLQDLLGFDKASKTLGWLLTKSLTAIKDLVEQTNNCLSSTLTDESKAAKLLETIIGDLDEQNCQKKKPLLKCVDGKGKKNMTQRSKSGSQMIFSREQSRGEARTRARERTKQKSRAKKLNDCCQIELQKGYKDMMSWECVMDQETSKKSKDSSFQNRAFHEQLLGNHAVNDSNLEYG